MAQANSHVPLGPEIRAGSGFTVAGIALDFTQDNKARIPELWTRFVPLLGSITERTGHATYGVCIPTDECDLRYMAAVEIVAGTQLASNEPLTAYSIPPAKYAVFTHEGSLDFIQQSFAYIFGEWLPQSDYESTGTPDFERYDERFNPTTDDGLIEIWVPVK